MLIMLPAATCTAARMTTHHSAYSYPVIPDRPCNFRKRSMVREYRPSFQTNISSGDASNDDRCSPTPTVDPPEECAMSDSPLLTPLKTARSLDNLIRRMHSQLMALGLEPFALIRIAPATQTPCLTELASPNFWATAYDPVLIGKDLLLQHAAHRDTPLFHSQIGQQIQEAAFDCHAFHRQQQLHRQLSLNGCHERYAIPLPATPKQQRCVLVLAGNGLSAPEFRARVLKQRQALHSLAHQFCETAQQHFARELDWRHWSTPIKKRPLQLLKTLAHKNLTLNEAAQHLHISISTANQHIAAAKRALNARTIAHAITKAVQMGLIEL